MGKQTAEERSLGRFLRNRAKELGTLLPPSADAPQPDTAMLWAFLSQQLAAGITNDATVIRRRPMAEPDPGGSAQGPGAGRVPAVMSKGAAARRGVVIAQPAPLPEPRDGGGGQVHVFWDVESAHPGDRDPRLVAAEVVRLARRLGQPAGCYAYATRAAWAWVPSHFVERYAHAAAADGGGGAGAGGDGGEGVDRERAAARGDGGPAAVATAAGGRLTCPLCGKRVSRSRLEGHIARLHADTDRTAAELVAMAEATAEAAAAAGADGGVRSGKGSTVAAAGTGGGAAGKGARGSGPGAKGRGSGGGEALSRTNTGKTGLGAVAAYYSSSGELFRPPAGHQLGLKYAVQREGFDPRVAQNADEASDRALNGGIDRLLAALRAAGARRGGGGGTSAGGREGECTLVIVSGSQRHGAALASCRRLGVRTVLVSPGGLDAAALAFARPGAGLAGAQAAEPDVVLDWELLATGTYQL
ncbi:hypothetical protein GPECTOR_8g138 [Gonium pectorale]|uniref:C2H2-type domain-containing protein n=1 Tax=Gonium pectorale TaxID=33097 RepID=A0A150GSB4_GONPE|nr:hypothetical protein GPECTOR_8g138 [Gonium pectorale]|eukprot:KXZ52746.1 hypothetical protein GPECTOR_8g138 [Gonium pectorale]